MSIDNLDRLLALRKHDAALDKLLKYGIGVEQLLKLAEEHGLDVTEDDLFAAQKRNDDSLTVEQLQRRIAEESRRLHHFIQG